MDPYAREAAFPGGVFSKEIPGGRAKALVDVSPAGLVARTEDGIEVRLAWRGLVIERGGAGGTTAFCRRGAQTVFSDADGFLRAVETAGGNDVADQLARLQGEVVATRWRHRSAWTLALALLAALGFAVPRACRASIDAAVGALPFAVDERIGRAVVQAMDPGGPEIHDPRVRAPIEGILERFEPYVELPGGELTFRVIDDAQVNAFALPGGYLTIYTGLLREADGPDEVAGVLAHEIAHVTERHGLRRVAQSVGTWAGLQLLLGDAEGMLALATQVFTLASVNDYSRTQESQADALGVRLLHAARMDPLALGRFFERLEREYGDVPEALAWTSTHPLHAERVRAVEALAGSLPARASEPIDVDWLALRAALDR